MQSISYTPRLWKADSNSNSKLIFNRRKSQDSFSGKEPLATSFPTTLLIEIICWEAHNFLDSSYICCLKSLDHEKQDSVNHEVLISAYALILNVSPDTVLLSFQWTVQLSLRAGVSSKTVPSLGGEVRLWLLHKKKKKRQAEQQYFVSLGFSRVKVWSGTREKCKFLEFIHLFYLEKMGW